MKGFFLFIFCISSLVTVGQNSVLSSGDWFKMSVTADGLYRIDYNQLKKLGINSDAINPKNIKIYTSGNGMLPQANSMPRVSDLAEVGIFVMGSDDGKFNTDDYILFFGQGPDFYQLNPKTGVFKYENNLFSDKNYYFITVGPDAGKRVNTIANIAGTYQTVSEFDDLSYYESELTNILHSGRDWFGEQFDTKTDYTIRFDIKNVIENSPIIVVSNVMGQSFSDASFQIFLNDIQIGEQKVAPLINSQYAIKGMEKIDTLFSNAAAVNASSRSNQDIKIHFTKAISGTSIGYLDFLLLQMKRTLALYGNQTVFHSLKSLTQSVTAYSVDNMNTNAFIWDITDSFNPSTQEISVSGTTATFAASSQTLKKYIVTSGSDFPVPTVEGQVGNQNIHGITSVDLLIVTAPEFLSEAQRLASYRANASSIKVEVVTTAEVYNEFSGGRQDVTAIRDAVRTLYAKNSGIKNLLLFGRGSYDYKNYLSYNKNYVPIYESRNSLSPLETYSSDDYFGFLELNEGNWGEDPVENNTLDVAVGRLPIKRLEEATNIVDKIIQFENQNWGEWRKEILFVADDGDFNIHQSQADELAEDLESDHPEFNSQKVYLDSYKQILGPTSQISPAATTALADAVRRGVAIVNYTGHGGEQQLAQERILDQNSLDEWKTTPKYPLLVTATCEFGRNDDPGIISTAELSLFRKNAGVIGLLTTARPVNSGTNFTLNKAFYQSLFTLDQNRFRDLGAIMKDTKNTSLSGVANRNFSLLCDPSMRISLPPPSIKVSEIKNISSSSDTLKALSKIRIIGSVYSGGNVLTEFNGTLVASIFDKPSQEITKGDENSPFQYRGHENAVFRGQASVHNGIFQFELILPSSVNPTVGQGKLGLYVSSTSFNDDRTGYQSILKIGSAEKNPGTDTKAPDIQLFMGDTTFVNGGIASKNSRVVAILTDESGINTSTFIPQKSLTAIVDDSLTYVVSEYYVSDVDNPSRGKLNFPIDNLSAGAHHVTLKASDTFGNTSSASIAFTVSDQSGILIEQFMNYPNPVSSGTTFRFKHNRSGEDIEAELTVFDQIGQTLLDATYQILGSAYQVDLPFWNATNGSGTKLGPGLYLCKVSVRSLLDGSKNDKITKVIIVN